MAIDSVKVKNKTWELAADLHFHNDFGKNLKNPAIVVAYPISSCKEQTVAIYAGRLAALGYVCNALTSRIGVLGICGGGGCTINSATIERRFKAVASVVAANYGRLCREGNLLPHAALSSLDNIATLRTKQASGAEATITSYIPTSAKAATDAGSPNNLNATSSIGAFNQNTFRLVDQLLTQPLQIIVGGGQPGAFGSLRDGFEIFNKARSDQKNILVIQKVTHYDLYNKPEAISQAMKQLESFFKKYL